MGTTPFFPDEPVPVGDGTVEDRGGGDSEDAFALCPRLEDGKMPFWTCWMEFFRDVFLAAAREDTPTAMLLALLRLRFLITSVLRESGRTTPCSFRNKPHALHRGCPSGLRRQRGVVCVKQFVHVVGAPVAAFWSIPRDPLALPGRDGSALPTPESGGVLGEERLVVECRNN